ncbi:MAG: dihydrofolate reductase family protein [Propionibacteriales bacterium]|nr:dihydrofolate reductase family protein [Propionibacteriales bacterium]
MARFVSTLFCSLDGVAEVDPAWHFPYFDEHMAAAVTEDYNDADALLLGRVTYDSFAGAWPDREAAGGEDAAFAAQLGDLRKLVATRGSQSLGWRNVEPVADLLTAIPSLRLDPDLRTILVAGSISIVRELLSAGELDELRLLMHPVLAGTGRRIFAADAGMQPLELVHSEAFPTGVVRLIYRPAALPGSAGYAEAAHQLGEHGEA